MLGLIYEFVPEFVSRLLKGWYWQLKYVWKHWSKYEVLSVTVANFWWQHSKRKFNILSKKSQKPPQSKKQSQQFFEFCDGSAPKCACGVYIFFTNKISFFSIVEVSVSSPDKFRYCNKDVKPGSGNIWLQRHHLSLDNPVTWSYSWVRVHFPLAVVRFCKEENGFLYAERWRTNLSVVLALSWLGTRPQLPIPSPLGLLDQYLEIFRAFGAWVKFSHLIWVVVWRRPRSPFQFRWLVFSIYSKSVRMGVTHFLPHNISWFLWYFFSPPWTLSESDYY